MENYGESMSLNGADAYGSSLMNPFSFSDEELLMHVTPGNLSVERQVYQPTSMLPVAPLQHTGTAPALRSEILAGMTRCLDNVDATSVAQPRPAVSEAQSRSTGPPDNPRGLDTGTMDGGNLQSRDMPDAQPCDLERAESRDGLEDAADHREKNRVAQKKFRARQKASLISATFSDAETSLVHAVCILTAWLQ